MPKPETRRKILDASFPNSLTNWSSDLVDSINCLWIILLTCNFIVSPQRSACFWYPNWSLWFRFALQPSIPSYRYSSYCFLLQQKTTMELLCWKAFIGIFEIKKILIAQNGIQDLLVVLLSHFKPHCPLSPLCSQSQPSGYSSFKVSYSFLPWWFCSGSSLCIQIFPLPFPYLYHTYSLVFRLNIQWTCLDPLIYVLLYIPTTPGTYL